MEWYDAISLLNRASALGWDIQNENLVKKSLTLNKLHKHLVDLLKIASTLAFWTSKMRGAGVSLVEKLGELEDPRRPSNGTRHDFREVLVIAVCAMLSDADSFEDIALWGRLKANWLRRFLVLENGIPSPDTFRLRL